MHRQDSFTALEFAEPGVQEWRRGLRCYLSPMGRCLDFQKDHIQALLEHKLGKPVQERETCRGLRSQAVFCDTWMLLDSEYRRAPAGSDVKAQLPKGEVLEEFRRVEATLSLCEFSRCGALEGH